MIDSMNFLCAGFEFKETSDKSLQLKYYKNIDARIGEFYLD